MVSHFVVSTDKNDFITVFQQQTRISDETHCNQIFYASVTRN